VANDLDVWLQGLEKTHETDRGAVPPRRSPVPGRQWTTHTAGLRHGQPRRPQGDRHHRLLDRQHPRSRRAVNPAWRVRRRRRAAQRRQASSRTACLEEITARQAASDPLTLAGLCHATGLANSRTATCKVRSPRIDWQPAAGHRGPAAARPGRRDRGHVTRRRPTSPDLTRPICCCAGTITGPAGALAAANARVLGVDGSPPVDTTWPVLSRVRQPGTRQTMPSHDGAQLR
jgi:hypothetical protein